MYGVVALGVVERLLHPLRGGWVDGQVQLDGPDQRRRRLRLRGIGDNEGHPDQQHDNRYGANAHLDGIILAFSRVQRSSAPPLRDR